MARTVHRRGVLLRSNAPRMFRKRPLIKAIIHFPPEQYAILARVFCRSVIPISNMGTEREDMLKGKISDKLSAAHILLEDESDG